MFELFNSKERDEDNWITLLKEADSRLTDRYQAASIIQSFLHRGGMERNRGVHRGKRI